MIHWAVSWTARVSGVEMVDDAEDSEDALLQAHQEITKRYSKLEDITLDDLEIDRPVPL